jgi:hypothetical protein
MRCTTRRSFVKVALGTLVLAGLPAWANDKKEDKGPIGTWARKEAELRMEFADKETLRIRPHGDSIEFTIVCSFTAKDGLVKARIVDLEGKAEILEQAKKKLPTGREFSFSWKVKDDDATLGDVKGEDADLLKSHLEGEYTKK